MKRIVVSVTNDLATDQRVHKVCTTLFTNGFDVLLIGRKLKNSQPVVRDYNTLSSPNKVFDYIQATTPILTSNTKIISKLVLSKNIGVVTNSHNPIALAKTVEDIFLNEQQYDIWCKNLKEVAKELNWENESKKLIKIFNSID